MEQVEADNCYRKKAVIDANSMDKSKIILVFFFSSCLILFSLDMQTVLT